MANTRSTTFSIRLLPETKRRLAKLAKTTGRSSNFLVSDALESYLEDQERQQAEIREALDDVDAGHYIPHEAMKAWLLSWGTERELPPPRCACGKAHDEDGVNGDRLVASSSKGSPRNSKLRRARQARRG